MKKIILLVLLLSIISCSQNDLKKWISYDQSSEIIENSENENQIKDFKNTIDLLGNKDKAPNVRAAESLINFYQNFKKV